MSQIFHRHANIYARLSILAVAVLAAALGSVVALLRLSGYNHGQDNFIKQPIQFSHAHHVGRLGIDCRYCHTSVEDVGLRRHSADQDLHELPLADLDQRADPGAGARQLPRRASRSRGRGCTTCPISSTSTTAST